MRNIQLGITITLNSSPATLTRFILCRDKDGQSNQFGTIVFSHSPCILRGTLYFVNTKYNLPTQGTFSW